MRVTLFLLLAMMGAVTSPGFAGDEPAKKDIPYEVFRIDAENGDHAAQLLTARHFDKEGDYAVAFGWAETAPSVARPNPVNTRPLLMAGATGPLMEARRAG
jgi:hypothetical protein